MVGDKDQATGPLRSAARTVAGSSLFLFEQQLVSAVQLAAQAKALQGTQGEGMNRLVAEIIDDWCGTPPRKGPRPHWVSSLSNSEYSAIGFQQAPSSAKRLSTLLAAL